MKSAFAKDARGAAPIHFVREADWPAFAKTLPPAQGAAAAAQGFSGKAGSHLLLTGDDGGVAGVLFGLDAPDSRRRDPFLPGKLATALPAGDYRFANAPDDAALAALAFLLGAYRFTRYRKAPAEPPRLVAPDGVDADRVLRMARGVTLARDLVNTPANDLGPDELQAALEALGERHKARVRTTQDGRGLRKDFPLVHAVGRASARKPRVVDLTWGKRGPRVTLVGKGVCFDTGGLDIKTSAGMALMKKDMGGAAAAMAAADMIMDAGLDVRLRLIVPIVENAISGEAFRTSDVYRSRKGLTVEIGNTDAEGRLILADALALGDEEAPDLMIDFATLTGAARVALGPDVPPFYTDDEALAAQIAAAAVETRDPVWRMPLWPGYETLLDSKIADLNSAAGGGFAGSIYAALFLRRFVERAGAWAHFDIYAWNPSAKPGRPEGGEAQAARLVYRLVEKRAASA